jgi:hypothetical protein
MQTRTRRITCYSTVASSPSSRQERYGTYPSYVLARGFFFSTVRPISVRQSQVQILALQPHRYGVVSLCFLYSRKWYRYLYEDKRPFLATFVLIRL